MLVPPRRLEDAAEPMFFGRIIIRFLLRLIIRFESLGNLELLFRNSDGPLATQVPPRPRASVMFTSARGRCPGEGMKPLLTGLLAGAGRGEKYVAAESRRLGWLSEAPVSVPATEQAARGVP